MELIYKREMSAFDLAAEMFKNLSADYNRVLIEVWTLLSAANAHESAFDIMIKSKQITTRAFNEAYSK